MSGHSTAAHRCSLPNYHAVAQIEPGAVEAAACALLAEERWASTATPADTAAQARQAAAAAAKTGALDRVNALFHDADSALLRRPRVMRSVRQSLAQGGATPGRPPARLPLLSRCVTETKENGGFSAVIRPN